MFQFENFVEAFGEFVKVSQHPEHDKYREPAALNAILAAEKLYELEQQSVVPSESSVPSSSEGTSETDNNVPPADNDENESNNP
jgi:hypothetical protein